MPCRIHYRETVYQSRLASHRVGQCLQVFAMMMKSLETLSVLLFIYMENLTHWGWVTHLCITKLTIIGSDNGLSPGRRQAIIWTNAGILLIWPLGTNFNEILIDIYIFPFKKMHLKMSFGKTRPSCLSLNVLTRKHLRIFFTVLIFSEIVPYKLYSCIFLFQYDEYLISAVDTDGLVLWRHGISSDSAEYTSMYFQLFIG